MQATLEQSQAIHIHDKNLIVVAGAGSGKTRVLVERYLALLAENPTWRISQLVAITFTREAAHEMRQRLRLELERRAQEAAKERWTRDLLQIDSARIDTIHGLCADIIRANAAQAGVDPQFEVLDASEAAIMLDEAVSDTLAQVEAPVSSLFAHYDPFIIEAAIKRTALDSTEHDSLDDPDAIFARWLEQAAEAVYAEQQRLLESSEALALNDIGYLPAGDKLADLALQYQDYLRQIEASEEAARVIELMQDCQARGAVGRKGSAKAWGSQEEKAEVAQILRQLLARVRSALKAMGEMPGELDRLAARLLPLWQELMKAVRQLYHQRKLAAAQLDFDDLERLAADLLDEESLRARYRGAEVKHLLVDEFQDTNAAQWRIIRALADEDAGGSLFVVGDPKQSIYQFRGADVSVFNRVARRFQQNPLGAELPLSISFRSHARLLEQFNALFAQLFTRDESSPVADYQIAFGKPMHAARKDSPQMPAIEIQLLDNEIRDGHGDASSGRRGRAKRYSAADMRRWEADELARHIKRLVAGDRQIHDKDTQQWRGLGYEDIALLFQSMTNVTIYEDAFKAQALPYITLAGRGYYDRQEVWDMLELLRFLHNPADDLALATVLRSPMFAFSDDLLLALRLMPAGDNGAGPLTLWQALEAALAQPPKGMVAADRPALAQAHDTLAELRRLSGRVTISELLRRALEKTNYLAILTGLPDGDRRRGNIEKLQRLALESGKITLGKFSRYLTDLSELEAREGEAHLEAGGALRLMTVHASKGLEFPLVILPDAAWERGRGGAPTLLLDPQHGLSCQVYDAAENKYVSGFAHKRSARLIALKEAEERKRLLYVAATRAQDYLLVSGSVGQAKDGRWTARGWLGQILGALDLQDIERQPEQTFEFASHPVSVLMPPGPPPDGLAQPGAQDGEDLWHIEADARQVAPKAPPLMQPLPEPATPALQHISASQISDIGAYRWGESQQQKLSAAQRFRQSALQGLDADSTMLSLLPKDERRLIGDIVHEALRYGDFMPHARASQEIISAIAWEKGLTSADALHRIYGEVERLLGRYHSSEVCHWVKAARAESRPVYTELPFMFRAQERVIHGVMDVALRQRDGQWTIIDYKTSAVAYGAYEGHARRYRLQLGVYAAALSARLELERPPQCFVHYIRHNRTVALAHDDCLRELERLEASIGELGAYAG